MRLALSLWSLPAIASLALSASLAAQTPDTLEHKVSLPVRDSALRLPTDGVSDLLPWVPGGGLDADANPNYHGTSAFGFTRRTDGVRWATGLRSLGAGGDGPLPVMLEPLFNSVRSASLLSATTGPYLIDLVTTSGGERWEARGQGESEGPFRPDGGAGVSRFEGVVGGPLGGGFRLRASGTLLGREAVPAGMGYAEAPYYVPTGIDTIVAVPNTDVLTDTSYVPVQRFGSQDKVPFTPGTATDWAVRVDGRLGPATVWAHWLGTRVAERLFKYADITNPLQASGYQTSGRDLAAGARLPIGAGLDLDLTLSLQHERSERGPLSSPGERDSRSPALGLMLDGVDLRFDMDNFPVDDELLTNYRTNTPGSRRSPYDLENTAQYALVDRYRNNPYGLLGWSESGGPVGRLAFYDDQRTLANAGATWSLGTASSVRVGLEIVRHDARSYAHTLTSQAFSNVWIETPQERAVTLDYTTRGAMWGLEAGLRFDRFTTGAVRPWSLVTDPSSSLYTHYVFFPRISSYGSGIDSLRRDVEDEAHSVAAPYVRVSGRAEENFELHAGFTRAARMPDLALLFEGLNTDLAITNSSQAFGNDMGHEITDLLEVGVTVGLGPVRLAGTIFHDKLTKQVQTRLESLYDPARNTNNDIRLHSLREGPAFQGLTFDAGWEPAAGIRLRGTYTWTDLSDPGYSFPSYGPDFGFRKHSVALTAEYHAPTRGPVAGLGALVSLRRASGLARSIDIGYDPWTYGPVAPYRAQDVPAWSSVDLRVTKRLAFGSKSLTVYLDGRNMLNAENLLRAFGFNEPRRAPALEDQTWSYDSAATAEEATRSGAYNAGVVDLTFSGAGRGGCGAWVSASGSPSAPNCAYLIAAEGRFGDGDGVYTLAEQRRASAAYYRTSLGDAVLTGPPRAIRLGLQVGF